jgi:hypothetical protein
MLYQTTEVELKEKLKEIISFSSPILDDEFYQVKK